MVRQWVEYYLTRIRTETVWDALTREQLRSVLEVRILYSCVGGQNSLFLCWRSKFFILVLEDRIL